MAGGRGGHAWQSLAAARGEALRGDAPLPGRALHGLLRGLAAEPPEAVWHPTGFLVLTVWRTEEGALRLHLWPEGPRERGTPCWPVHDHVWDLRSQVLCGEVESRAYEVVDDPRGEAVLYAVGYGDGRRSCMRRSARRVRVRAQAPQRVGAGERYAVAAGECHASTVAVGDLAATLAATVDTPRPWPWVVGDGDGPAEVPVERPLAEPSRVVPILRRLTER